MTYMAARWHYRLIALRKAAAERDCQTHGSLPISMDISRRSAGSGAPREFAKACRKVRSSASAMFVVDGSADHD